MLLDLAVPLGLGGDCLASPCCAEPGAYGLVASDPTVSCTIDALATDAPAALAAIDAARAVAREQAWELAGEHAPHAGIDAAPDGTGEPLSVLLRPGNAARTPPLTTSS